MPKAAFPAYTDSCYQSQQAKKRFELIGAVDIGGTKIAVAAVHENGRIAWKVEWRTAALPVWKPQAAVRRMGEYLRMFGKELRGVGVGCTGPVDPLSGVVGNVDLLPGWSGFPLAEKLSGETGLSVAVENDADAAALGEAAWGAGRKARRFLYVTISTGIGAGLVIDGALYRGVDGCHPEPGHQTLDPAGPKCYCGATGCWESLASGPALVKWMQANANVDDQLPPELSAHGVCDLARQGHPLAVRAVARHGMYLGLGLVNLVTIFCPDVIALGGGVMKSGDLFLESARAVVRARCGLVPFEKTRIVPAALGPNAGLLGAARVWQTRFQESGVRTSDS